jgi:hypothetical protein
MGVLPLTIEMCKERHAEILEEYRDNIQKTDD